MASAPDPEAASAATGDRDAEMDQDEGFVDTASLLASENRFWTVDGVEREIIVEDGITKVTAGPVTDDMGGDVDMMQNALTGTATTYGELSLPKVKFFVLSNEDLPIDLAAEVFAFLPVLGISVLSRVSADFRLVAKRALLRARARVILNERWLKPDLLTHDTYRALREKLQKLSRACPRIHGLFSHSLVYTECAFKMTEVDALVQTRCALSLRRLCVSLDYISRFSQTEEFLPSLKFPRLRFPNLELLRVICRTSFFNKRHLELLAASVPPSARVRVEFPQWRGQSSEMKVLSAFARAPSIYVCVMVNEMSDVDSLRTPMTSFVESFPRNVTDFDVTSVVHAVADTFLHEEAIAKWRSVYREWARVARAHARAPKLRVHFNTRECTSREPYEPNVEVLGSGCRVLGDSDWTSRGVAMAQQCICIIFPSSESSIIGLLSARQPGITGIDPLESDLQPLISKCAQW